MMMLAGILRATTPFSYFVFSFSLTVLALALPILLAGNSPYLQRLTFVVVAGGAVPAVLLTWLGGYDAVLVLLMACAAMAKNRWVIAAAWGLLSYSHYALAAISLILWLPVYLNSRDGSRRQRILTILVSCIAAVVGLCLSEYLVESWGGGASRWELFQAIGITNILASYVNSYPLMIFSALGIGWLLFVNAEVWFPRSTIPRDRLTLLMAAAIIVPIPIIWIGAPIHINWMDLLTRGNIWGMH